MAVTTLSHAPSTSPLAALKAILLRIETGLTAVAKSANAATADGSRAL